MAVIWVHIAKTASKAVERTEPDVHLIKQVKHVTKSALEGPMWRFAPASEHGGTDSVEIFVRAYARVSGASRFSVQNRNARVSCPSASKEQG
jgi:hypothetical protein